MLLLHILNGPRKGVTLNLLSASEVQRERIVLCEDDVIRFEVSLNEDLSNLSLALHDNEIQCTNRYERDGKWVYEWRPKETFNRKESFFLNFYGLAELSLIARSHKDNEDFAYFVELNPIEILAKKINAERISAMLHFLARQDGKDLAAAIRVTRIRAGYKEGGRSENFLLDRIEHNLNFLKKVLPIIATNAIATFNQKSRVVIPNRDTLIDDRSIGWVIENPDILYSAYSDEAFLNIDGENFNVSNILESHIQATTDVYENQVLQGFVATLISATKSIQIKLQQGARGGTQVVNVEGYVSFFSQLNKFSAAINRNRIDKCARLISELVKILNWLERRIPVKKKYLGIPQFTQKAKSNLFYQQVFNRVISWHRFGAPDWGFQEELNSIKDIPKLFEYYLLCVVKNHLETMGTEDNPVIYESENADGDHFKYRWGTSSITLMYEPQIWTVDHAQSTSMNIVNTEGWTTKNNQWGNTNIEINKRGSFGGRSNRCPDILIECSAENEQTKHIIIDAKYTDSKRAFLTYLPELTMKYIHGIHQKTSGDTSSVALMIVNPDEFPNTRHFHNQRYSIYGKMPVTPALMVTSIDVSNAHSISSNLRSDLSRIVELIFRAPNLSR